jgi:hypothetical protein
VFSEVRTGNNPVVAFSCRQSRGVPRINPQCSCKRISVENASPDARCSLNVFDRAARLDSTDSLQRETPRKPTAQHRTEVRSVQGPYLRHHRQYRQRVACLLSRPGGSVMTRTNLARARLPVQLSSRPTLKLSLPMVRKRKP